MNFRMFWRPKLILCKIGMIEKSWNFHTVRCYVKLIFQIWSQKLHFVSFLRHKIRMAEYSQNFFADADDFMEKTCLGCHIQYLFSRAPLVGSLDMDYWCSAFGTKGARVNKYWIWHPKHVLDNFIVAQINSQKNSSPHILSS